MAVKPTYGVVSRYGVVAFGSSLDQVGPFARSVEDAALALNAISGRDELDCTSQPCDVDFAANLAQGVRGMKIGIVPAFMEAAGLAPEVKAKVEEAASALEKMGAQLVEVELPHAQAAMSAYYVLGPCEAFSNLARFDSVRYGYCDPGHKDLGGQYEASRAAGFGAEAAPPHPARQLPPLCRRLRHATTTRLSRCAPSSRGDYAAAYEKVDVILAPVAPRTAFKLGEIGDPTEMYLARHVHHLHQHRRQRRPVLSRGPRRRHGPSRGRAADRAPHSRTRTCSARPRLLEAVYGPAPVAPDFADGKVGA